MKKHMLSIAAGLFLSSSLAFAQDISADQVPSLVVNNFQKSFPKATDIEWEKDGDLYQADFETGISNDHEAWFNNEGVLVKHQEEISKDALPNEVLTKIKSQFGTFRIDDTEKITSGTITTYQIELKKLTEEVKVVFSSSGEVISQVNN